MKESRKEKKKKKPSTQRDLNLQLFNTQAGILAL